MPNERIVTGKRVLLALFLNVVAFGSLARAQTGQDLLTQLRVCLARIEGNPRYSRIYEKLGVATATDLSRMPTQKQLSDTDPISAADIALGREWHDQVRTCDTPVIAGLEKTNPQFQTYFEDRETDVRKMIDDIVSRKITTFAQANARLSVLKEHAQISGELLPKPTGQPQHAVPPDYAAALSAWLEAHKQYPENARLRREQGRAVVRFRVDRSGRVLDYAIVSGTGFPDLDAGVNNMMQGAIMPPFPASMTMPEIIVTVAIRFGLVQPAVQ